MMSLNVIGKTEYINKTLLLRWKYLQFKFGTLSLIIILKTFNFISLHLYELYYPFISRLIKRSLVFYLITLTHK